MPLEAPRWWWIALAVALFVLALGGGLNAVEEGMRDNYASNGCGFPYGGSVPPEEQPEGVDCPGQRLRIGVMDALASATFGPGLALTILAGVYLIGSAIALALGGRPEQEDPRRDGPAEEGAGGAPGGDSPVEEGGRQGRFSIPRRWAFLVVTGLVLLAVAGAADSLGNAMRDNYTADCDVFDLRVNAPREESAETDPENNTEDERTPPTQEEREACRDARWPVTIVDVVTRAALGPGIAIVSLTGVFIVASAIGMRRR